jgi:hypothetical protein
MTSSMTSHATFGNSTFAEPRSAETTISSIDGPSDFTEHMFDYMKGNKKPTDKKPSRIKSKVEPKVKLKVKHHLNPDESGIIIESPSEFSDDALDYLMPKKPMISPAKSGKSDLDGPSDFTANLVDYMKGTKADSLAPQSSSPVAKMVASTIRGVATDPKIMTSPAKSEISDMDGPSDVTANVVDYMKGTKTNSPLTNKPSPVTETAASIDRGVATDPKPVPKLNKNLVINGQSNFTASLAAFINGTSANSASVHTTSSPKPIITRPMSSPAKGENFDLKRPSDFTLHLAEYVNAAKKESGVATTPSITQRDKQQEAKKAGLAGQTGVAITTSITKKDKQQEAKNASPAVKTGAATTPSITEKHERQEVKKAGPAMQTVPASMRSTKTLRSAKHDDFELDGPSDFTENLVDYMNGTKKQTSAFHMNHNKKEPKKTGPALNTPPTSMRATKNKPLSKHDDSEVEGPSDFTENLVDYMKGTKYYSPPTKTLSPAFNASRNSAKTTKKASNNTQEDNLRKQIAQLQAQLQQKDDTIDSLQTSLTVTEERTADLESEVQQKYAVIDKLQTSLQQKDDTIDTLQTSLTVAEEKTDGLESELEQKDAEIDKLQTSLMEVHNNVKLEATISALQKSQAEMEEKQEKREEELHARVQLLLQEIDRRGAACMQLWGELEHPGERDGKGRQKYTYKYTKKSTKGASII